MPVMDGWMVVVEGIDRYFSMMTFRWCCCGGELETAALKETQESVALYTWENYEFSIKTSQVSVQVQRRISAGIC